ncbi:MAG: ShlB/FhaC/HecB family hemolysin secretion/activation protein, partial [Methylobacillus glycogenes]|nr:ShlB/FhaC/HecB family hemolysin secretion/activation protein [Methylobacillus glycogenes]
YGAVAGPSSDYLLGRRLAGGVLGLKGGYKAFQYDGFVGRPLKRPEGFQTAHTTAGIQLSLTF